MSKMVKIEPTRHQVAVAGQVTDKETGRAVSRAQVAITTAPSEFQDWLAIKKIQYGERWDSMTERPDRTQTAADGYYYFMDLFKEEFTRIYAGILPHPACQIP